MGTLASEFVEVLELPPADGRIASEFVESFQVQAADGRLASEFVECFQVHDTIGRLGSFLVEVFMVPADVDTEAAALQGAALLAVDALQGTHLRRRRGQL